MRKESIQYASPQLEDGKKMWQLASHTTLDDNSAYKYIMMCQYFKETCVVAKDNQNVLGFITGFIPPENPNTVFVWQISVDPNHSGKGIASKLLKQLVSQVKSKGVNYVEATITPSNKASQALFKKLATSFDTDYQVESFLTQDLFPDETFEEELKYRIGPLY
ncbi:diaminobutyrate acetyltransferase [Pelagirhabdus alkalitolerans]|uniref:L-2,4-diaminobutyric acid acetyltransferase n=1 Tax=Pelagirhabdus alkalitolerans TaxID=1612202 RepID=A0A1G6JLV0_9BACI|nr:diaminobutyrate acetyltransferase [Pelagirhabdus alkalitolerans]SDC19742.1 diaminobutyrate acetyltransferase [Pelagirhabdus alkalitolerans]